MGMVWLLWRFTSAVYGDLAAMQECIFGSLRDLLSAGLFAIGRATMDWTVYYASGEYGYLRCVYRMTR